MKLRNILIVALGLVVAWLTLLIGELEWRNHKSRALKEAVIRQVKSESPQHAGIVESWVKSHETVPVNSAEQAVLLRLIKLQQEQLAHLSRPWPLCAVMTCD